MAAAPFDPPGTLFIELTSHCNMHCGFCPSDVLRRPKGHLSEERLRKFLDEVRALGITAPVLLNVLGEPLLNKRLYSLLDEFEAEGRPATLITNMTLLRDRAVREELLRHPNLTLALSLQTATPRSYKLRGYDRLPFKEFFGTIFEAVEDKFRTGSGVRLEIHVASNFVLSRDPTVQADGELSLWPNFPNERAERRWIRRMMVRLERMGKRMRRRYPGAYEAETAAAAIKYRDHIGTKIAVDRAGLPPDFHHLKDEVFWGYMVLPNVFLVFKSLELWTRSPAFLRAALPPGKFAYVEEREDPRTCVMAENLGLLSGGGIILCCLDYEGEMGFGNIDTTSVEDALRSEARAAARRDAMTAAVCRRCKGNVFIFDTSPLDAREQEVDKFGRGWWGLESGLYGIGGRWTKGRAWSYVFARISARSVRLAFRSEFEEGSPFELTVFFYDEGADRFEAEAVFPMPARMGGPVEFEAPFAFAPGRLYRLQLDSPVFVPDDTLHNGDLRRLGLAVFSISLRA